MRIIIGLSGEMASGKDTVKKYLGDKYGASLYKFSSLVRDILKIVHIPDNRENMTRLSILLRKEFGESVFSRVMFEKMKNEASEYVVIDGIRRPEDIEYLKSLAEFKFLYVESDIKKRYERIIKRKENPGDENKTFEEFKKEHELNTEVGIRALKEYADYVIENDGALEELHKKIDDIIKKSAHQE